MTSIKILLVEDNPADQIMVEEVLQDATTFQYQLATCERVQDAPDCIAQVHPDIILLDLSLPDSSGLVTLEKIKECSPQVPVVIFTGLADHQVGIEAINQGAEDYLVKGDIRDGSTLERTINFALERHKLRQELVHTMDHLKRSNQKLEDFAYVVSHDLKSPIGNLRSLVDMFNRDAIGDDYNRQVMTMIDGSVSKLSNMLSSFMSVFLTEEGFQQSPEKLTVEASLNDVLRALTQLIDDTNTTINTDFSEVPTMVFVPVLFQSILQNLITNSIKYRSPERDPVIQISSHDGGDYVVLHFQDNGIGIDTQRNQRNLFKLFKRFNPKHAEGNGVGLYTIKSILDTSGGKIDIESEVGEGTLFKLYFSKVRELVGK
ncbi:MAG: ATP-binding protein [Tunicatimonas sp.]